MTLQVHHIFRLRGRGLPQGMTKTVKNTFIHCDPKMFQPWSEMDFRILQPWTRQFATRPFADSQMRLTWKKTLPCAECLSQSHAMSRHAVAKKNEMYENSVLATKNCTGSPTSLQLQDPWRLQKSDRASSEIAFETCFELSALNALSASAP